MNLCCSSTAVLVLILLTASSAAQNVLDVPGSYPTIQAAIVAASPGDQVLVAAGTYFERIDFLGKDIEVVGAGAGNSIIQGGGLQPGSAVTFASGETRAARLARFTVSAGSGTHLLVGAADKLIGGGILCLGASPTIEDCRIANNILPSLVGPFIMYGGGGIAISGTGAHPMVRRCTIEDNIVNTPTSGLVNLDLTGGGVLVDDGAIGQIEDCVIRDNEVATAPGLGDGGGIGALAPLGVVRCTITGNTAGDGGGAMALDVSHFELCRITGNTASTGCGGGLALGDTGGGPVQAVHDVSGCIVADNVAAMTGGGVFASSVHLDHTTVTRNTAPAAAGLHLPLGLGVIERSIVWGNSPAGFCSETVLIVDSCVAGATATGCSASGSSNVLDVDPMMADPMSGDYRLTGGSPCRDAAASISSLLTTDIDGDPRVFPPAADMGADEFYGFDDSAAGTVGVGAGGPFDVVMVTAESGGFDRRVEMSLTDPFTFFVDQPPTNPNPADFIIFGFVAVPAPDIAVEIPGLGLVVIPIALLTPGVPGAFTLAASSGLVPSALLPAVPTPWGLACPPPPVPLSVSFQGVIEDAPGHVAVTNAVILDYR